MLVKRIRAVAPVIAGLLFSGLLLFASEPGAAGGFLETCESGAEVIPHCCACSPGDFCKEVQHQGVTSCTTELCSSQNCYW